MLNRPLDILTQFPVRRTNAQKQAFRDAVQAYAQDLGYHCRPENKWLLIGSPNEADYVVCAGNADSAIMTILEILRTLPENRRSRVAFVLYENPFWDMYSYVRKHPEVREQLVFYLEQVGSGDRIRFFPTKQLQENRSDLTSLYKACGYFGKKNLLVQEKNVLPWFIPFHSAVSVCCMANGKKENYRNRIKRDTPLDISNINILRAALVSYFCCAQPK